MVFYFFILGNIAWGRSARSEARPLTNFSWAGPDLLALLPFLLIDLLFAIVFLKSALQSIEQLHC